MSRCIAKGQKPHKVNFAFKMKRQLGPIAFNTYMRQLMCFQYYTQMQDEETIDTDLLLLWHHAISRPGCTCTSGWFSITNIFITTSGSPVIKPKSSFYHFKNLLQHISKLSGYDLNNCQPNTTSQKSVGRPKLHTENASYYNGQHFLAPTAAFLLLPRIFSHKFISIPDNSLFPSRITSYMNSSQMLLAYFLFTKFLEM